MKTRAKNAKQVFHKCHVCHSTSLTAIGSEVFCDDCEWNSIEASVAAGCMDNLFRAYIDHFYCDQPSPDESQAMKPKVAIDGFAKDQRPAKVS